MVLNSTPGEIQMGNTLPCCNNKCCAPTVNAPVELESGRGGLWLYQSWMCICIGVKIFQIIMHRLYYSDTQLLVSYLNTTEYHVMQANLVDWVAIKANKKGFIGFVAPPRPVVDLIQWSFSCKRFPLDRPNCSNLLSLSHKCLVGIAYRIFISQFMESVNSARRPYVIASYFSLLQLI